MQMVGYLKIVKNSVTNNVVWMNRMSNSTKSALSILPMMWLNFLANVTLSCTS